LERLRGKLDFRTTETRFASPPAALNMRAATRAFAATF
jgi:hypothetical protein